jgi:hypothetical protein
LFDVEIRGSAFAGKRADLVGLADMERVGVVLGKDGRRADTHLGGRAHDADGYFAAIGDKKTSGKHLENRAAPVALVFWLNHRILA